MTGRPPSTFQGSAAVELHTLLAHRHVDRYLIALGSLLPYWTELSVVVHDDGTLDRRDHKRIEAFGAVRVIDRADADAEIEGRFADLPLLLRTRRGNPRLLQLVDYFALAGTPRVLAMDSDVVFLRRPDRLIGWAAGDDPAAVLYSPERGWEAKGMHWLPGAVPGQPFIPDMCCGFVAADAATFFDAVALDALMQQTDPEILPRPRFVTQMLYSLMAGRLTAGLVEELGEPYRSGRPQWLPDCPERVICHYFGSHDDENPLDDVVAAYPALRPLLEGAGG